MRFFLLNRIDKFGKQRRSGESLEGSIEIQDEAVWKCFLYYYSDSSAASFPDLAATRAGAITIPMKAKAMSRSCIQFFSLCGFSEPVHN
jgi:hypothetical protein